MLSSPRRPSSTMRILSSAEKCRRVARRMFFTTCVAGSFPGTDFCLICAPSEGYDEPEILPSSTHPICLMSADGGHTLNVAASPTDKTYANQLKGAAILEPIFKRQPRHPGVAHYLIHLYDTPALAERGIDAARRYSKIAPAAP